ncbi:hypothetical protein LXA43DRAFT_864128, partial [Ganoderma leucocontextum]
TVFVQLGRVITNHTVTSAHRAKFYPCANEPTNCTCHYSPRGTPIHNHHHVLFECPLYYRRETIQLKHLFELDLFLKILSFFNLNHGTFFFQDA